MAKHVSMLDSSSAKRVMALANMLARGAARKAWLKVRIKLAGHEHRHQLEEQVHMQNAQEAVELMGNMKGVFMKLGQIMSFANHSLPEETRKVLKDLQQNAPPMSWDLARGVLEEELGHKWKKTFSWIDREPLASASIGQVHKAKLRNGDKVVIKIQYPGVAQAIKNDLKASDTLANMISMISKTMDSRALADELATQMLDELDYRKEAKNQMLFAEIWARHPLIHIPAVYPEHSSERVLVQEFREGLNFYEFLEVANAKEKSLASAVLFDFVYESMYVNKVFNADPHPGNYIFHEDGSISFLDFGCIKSFEDDFIYGMLDLTRSLVEHDKQAFENIIREMGIVLPAAKYDLDLIWDVLYYHATPYLEDKTFCFDSAWLEKGKQAMDLKLATQLNLPRDMLFLNRITFGINALLYEMGSPENYHQMMRRYLYRNENLPPAVALKGIELDSKYVAFRPGFENKIQEVS